MNKSIEIDLEKSKPIADMEKQNDISNELRTVMRGVASTVTIISAECAGNRYGMVATTVTSISLTPPSMLFCINRSASSYEALVEKQFACINILTEEHAKLCQVFSKPGNKESRFTHGEWSSGYKNLPYLIDAQANIFLRISQQIECGSHDIFVGQVEDIIAKDVIAPLLYVDGQTATAALK